MEVLRIKIESVGVCDAGHKVGDVLEIPVTIPLKITGSEGWCWDLLHSAYATCTAMAFGGKFPWEDEEGNVLTQCPDPKGLKYSVQKVTK